MIERMCERTGRLGLVLAILMLGPLPSMPQGTSGQIDQSLSSEWEATAFNNGRRMVRDSNGYFHAFWHSGTSGPQPVGTGCDIFYSCTTTTAVQPPSMAQSGNWSTPVNMTKNMLPPYADNRYPSVAIEYDSYGGQWKTTNRIHIVWQALDTASGRYEVVHASLPVADPPSTQPLTWMGAANLSHTLTDSLVPAIAINHYGPGVNNQHIHVVWQEEDVNSGGQPGAPEDAWFSDIAYIRSVDSGATWAPPAGGWDPDGLGPLPLYGWDNLSQTPLNSQMPTIACILDQYAGSPAQAGRGDLGYNSPQVHVAYNEDLSGPGGIHVYHTNSPNDGINWLARTDVSLQTGGEETTVDAYPNIAADMLDAPHIVFMRQGITKQEPLRTAGPLNDYLPGINPILGRSFPGPAIGMYNAATNSIVYAWQNAAVWLWNSFTGPLDREFPTVALDRWMHLNVNWQQFILGMPSGNYEVMRTTRINANPPAFPPSLQNYGTWSALANDSQDAFRDDLFPNLAFKKTSMYMSPNESGVAGYDEVWTKIGGTGEDAALYNPKEIWQDGNTTWDVSVPVHISRFSVE